MLGCSYNNIKNNFVMFAVVWHGMLTEFYKVGNRDYYFIAVSSARRQSDIDCTNLFLWQCLGDW